MVMTPELFKEMGARERLRWIAQNPGTPPPRPALRVGDLVTGAECQEGEPRWVGVIEVVYPQDGLVIGLLGGDRGRIWPGEVRHITDAEAIALVEALTWERWTPVGPGAGSRLGAPLHETGGLRVYGSGAWEMWLPGRSMPEFVTMHRGGAVAAKAAASRAFLAHLCRAQ